MIRMTNFCSTALPTILREGAGGGSGGGGLVDLDANDDGGGNGGEGGNGAAQTVEVDFGGEKIALPSKAAEELTALRGKIADHGKVTAPETYALNLPDALKGKVEVSDKHPLYAPVSEWARKHNLPQEAFDEL
ncbi:MAG: hypothetical protein RBS99_12040, partial [Rhodospirillales bacterium]|nr:hypothetical protein [Rhodospirillales bacterium]